MSGTTGFGGFATRPAPSFDPRQLPQLKKWLNWAGATDTGTLSIPDVLGGAPATQSTGALKPIVGTADNGVRIGTFNTHVLSLPLSAAINDNLKFGIAFWAKIADVVGTKTFVSVQNGGAGTASANRVLVNMFGATLQVRAQAVDRRAGISSLGTNWHFCYIGVDCSKATEPTQVIMSLDGLFGNVAFSNDTAWPSSLGTPTGNMMIGGTTTSAGAPLIGSVGDIYFFTDHLGVVDQLRLLQYKRPIIVPLVGNVVALGNSITEGAGLTTTQNYPVVLGATLGHDWQVFNCGHSSWTTTMLLNNFAEVQSHFTYQTTKNILVVNEVSNEIDQGVSEATARQNMQALIAKGRANGWRVFFATTTPRTVTGTWTAPRQLACANINDFFRNNPSERDGFIDWAAESHLANPTDPTYYQDGVHPTAAGAAIMAAMTNTAITA